MNIKGRPEERNPFAGKSKEISDESSPVQRSVNARNPLSYQQRGLWFLDSLSPQASAAYRIMTILHLKGELDADALEQAFRRLVDRHEILRTHFETEAGEPIQVTGPPDCFRFDRQDIEADDVAARVEAVLEQPFDLRKGPLFRAHLLRLSPREHVLIYGGHHSILDGWSMGVLSRELTEAYQAARSMEPVTKPALPIQYGDYARWQHKNLPADRLREETQWWSDYLAHAPEDIALPFDRTRPARMRYQGDSVPVVVHPATTEALRTIGRRTSATLFMVLEIALAVLLCRLGAGPELVIGTAIANRPRREFEGLIGYFVNTVALRHSLDPSACFETTLMRGREAILSALEHGHVPFETVVDAVRPTRSLSHNPLLQVMCVLQNWSDGATGATPVFQGLDVAAMPEPSRSSRFDLELSLLPRDGGLEGVLFFDTHLFDRSSADRIATMYTRLLSAIATTPKMAIGDLPLLDSVERRELLADFSTSGPAISGGDTIIDQFAARVADNPERGAVVDGETTLTYRQLDAVSNRLARLLAGSGAGPETVIGLCLERSAASIVAMLAVWKTGAAFLPMAREEPPARRDLMLRQARAHLMVTTGDLQTDQRLTTIVLDAPDTVAALSRLADTPLSAIPQPRDLAYVIFTSGSIGTPKGVAVEHDSLAGYLAWARKLFAPKPGITVPVTTQLTVDITSTSLWLALISGCRALLLEPLSAAAQLLEHMRQGEPVGLAKLPPVQLADLIEASRRSATDLSWPGVLVLGGEALKSSLVQPLFEQHAPRIFNHYGPTEATVGCVIHSVRPEDLQRATVPIGRPAPGIRAYVVDRRMEPQPIGVAGELLIGGIQLARGYLGAPALTAERFMADPFSCQPGARLYRTGDLARWRDDGTLEFLGRIDHQIKIRGIRIEPAEIEAALAGVEDIESCVVVSREDQDAPSQTRLVAYLVPSHPLTDRLQNALKGAPAAPAGAVFDLNAIRATLKDRLPEVMIPSMFVALPRLPLNATGKVDRTALPDSAGDVAQHRYAAPRDELESLTCLMMRDVIRHDRVKLEQVGIDDNFFDIGGHSIFAAQFCSRLGAALARDVPVRWLFETPTPRALVEKLRHSDSRQSPLPPVEPVGRDRPIPASFEQERMWLLNEIHADRPVFNEGIALLLSGPDLDDTLLRSTIRDLIDRFEVLRTRLEVSDEGLRQIVLPPGSVDIGFEDWGTRRNDLDLRTDIAQRASSLVDARYTMDEEALCRILIIKTSPQRYAWVMAMHHAAVDNWSMSHVLLRDFVEMYRARAADRAPDLPDIRLHYADYAAWQRSAPVRAEQDRQLKFWRNRLSGVDPPVPLPSDRPPPTVRNRSGERVQAARIDALDWRRIEQFAVRHNCSPYMVFATALTCALCRMTGTAESVIGVPHVARPHPELWQEFGYFGNTLILRERVRNNESFVEMLARIRANLVEAMQHQEVPIEAVLSAAGLDASILRVLLVMHAYHDSTNLQSEDLSIDLLDVMPPLAKYDLTIDIQPATDGATLSVEYATDIFEEGTVRRITTATLQILFSALASPRASTATLPLLDDAETRRLLVDFNAGDVSEKTVPEATVLDLFVKQAEEHPDAIAVLDGSDTLSYRALHVASNRLAQRLKSDGVRPESIVGVCLERSAELVVALLAIWKAGAAYLPLATDDPPARQAHILDESNAILVISRTDVCTEFNCPALLLDTPDSKNRLAGLFDTGVVSNVHPDSLAYVIYTSGSTGAPKGVATTHQGITRLVSHAYHGLDKSGRILNAAHVAFDATTFELWAPLSAGGCVVIHGDRLLAAGELQSIIERQRISAAWLTAGLFHAFVRDQPRFAEGLRTLLVGGDVVEVAAVAQLKSECPHITLLNGYGPTETTTFATTAELFAPSTHLDRVPLGRPLPRTTLHVCDKGLMPVPVGVAGELLIGGTGVARGYLNAPGLTAERFIADPFSGQAGARLYRTGDRVRWRDDGTIEFLGRLDRQTKIRGTRVEPAEVEAALLQLGDIEACAVIGLGAPSRLVAYLVPKAQQEERLDSVRKENIRPSEDVSTDPAASAVFDLDAIRTALKTRLPEAMVPSHFVTLPRLPLNAAGKVNRAALPDVTGDVARRHYVGPRDELESLTCAIMLDVIQHDRALLQRVGIDDNFFDIGGHSIFAAQFCSRLAKALSRNIPVRWLFETSTPRELAERLRRNGPEQSTLPPVASVPRDGVVPASFEQERMWLLNKIHGGKPVYNEGVALAFAGPVDTQAFSLAVQDVLDRYEVLRTRLTEGEDGLFQSIDPPGALTVTLEDWSAEQKSLDALREKAKHRCLDLQTQPYDLTARHPCRVLIIKLSAQLHILCFAVHHVAADNWSMSHILPGDLTEAYAARRRGHRPDLPHLPLSFADYACWQRSAAVKEASAHQLRYWTEKLRDAGDVDLPSSRPRPKERDFLGHRITVARMPWEIWRKIETTAAAHGCSPFMFFTAITWTLLARVSGSGDITIGTPHTTKPDAALWQVFGYFGNTLALRGRIDAQAPFGDLLTQARSTVLEALANQDVPFEAIVETLGIRPANTTPLFQVFLVMHAFLNEAANTHDDMTVTVFAKRPQPAKYDLLIDVNPTDGGVRIDMVYATDMFDEPLIRRLGTAFDRLARTAIDRPQMRIGSLPLVEARSGVSLAGAMPSSGENDDHLTVVDLFRRRCARRPNATAIIDGDHRLSYSALEAASNRLARYLSARGISTQVSVGVCLSRSTDLVVTLLAIWKVGGVYLPLNPNDPPARRRLMAQDAATPLIVTQSAHAEHSGHDLLLIDNPATRARIDRLESTPPRTAPPDRSSLAYIIYTSGSTGAPKGVAQSHATLRNLADWAETRVPERARGMTVFHRTISFDGSIRDIVCGLSHGGTLTVVRHGLPEADFETFTGSDLPISLYVTPSLFRHLNETAVAHLAGARQLHLTFAGEMLSIDSAIASRLEALPNALIHNDYGPTETHAATSGDVLRKTIKLNAQPSVGRPAPGLVTYVVDANLEPLPIGVPGELLMGGIQLAWGYVRRPTQTAERFIADPFSGASGARLYRTGDRAVLNEDGTLRILGRLDEQVKIRGQRVEPAEIEAVLLDQPGIRACAVLASDPSTSNDDIALRAYLVPERQPETGGAMSFPAGTAVDLNALKEALRERLPDYMIPSRYVGLTHLPLTISGKLDRKALPDEVGETANEAYLPPISDLEITVARAFRDILGDQRIGRNDDFFSLGGHSLLAVRLCLLLARMTGIELPARQIFAARSVAAIARRLDEHGPDKQDAPAMAPSPRERQGAAINYQGAPQPIERSRGVIVTGATGFLGRHVLRRLIDRSIPAICPIRAGNQEEARERLRMALLDVGVRDVDTPPGAVRALAVDYGQMNFGLSSGAIDSLADSTDTILHCAAQVNFLQRADELIAPNVTLVENLLDLSVRREPMVFHHISTLGVYGPATTGSIAETTEVLTYDAQRTGYATTKAWAEHCVERMSIRGLRTTILRPALIVGNTFNGLVNSHDAANAFLGLCSATGCVPESPPGGFRMVAIDAIADAILELLNQATLPSQPVHLMSWPGMTHLQLQDAGRKAGIVLDVVDGWEWSRRCGDIVRSHPDHRFAWYANSRRENARRDAPAAERGFQKPVLPAHIQTRLNKTMDGALVKALKALGPDR